MNEALGSFLIVFLRIELFLESGWLWLGMVFPLFEVVAYADFSSVAVGGGTGQAGPLRRVLFRRSADPSLANTPSPAKDPDECEAPRRAVLEQQAITATPRTDAPSMGRADAKSSNESVASNLRMAIRVQPAVSPKGSS
ncbi:hypothetical protein [Cystobacter fuscus]|uniref:hypothetical protein n=1 Tax=Cystobacter fuscus TaxID=43 RepID=UPI001E4D340B|nr:hypothetical protein [Cystobacter fuscus]